MYTDGYEENQEEYQDGNVSNNQSYGFYQNKKLLIGVFIAVILIVLVILLFSKKGSGDSGGGNSNKYAVNITPETEVVIPFGGSASLTATVNDVTNPVITWTSSDDTIATVNNGSVTGVKYGQVIITATYARSDNEKYLARKSVIVADGTKGVTLTDISIGDSILTMPPSGTYSITYEAIPTTAYVTNKTYSSSNQSVVTVDEKGYITAVGVGEAIVAINVNDGAVTRRIRVFVNNDYTNSEIVINPTKVTLNKETTTIKVGETAKLSYTIEPTEASNAKVNWTSSNESILTVDSGGIITGVQAGKATVKATTLNGISDSFEIEVQPNTVAVTDIQVSISDLYLETGQTQQITPVILPTDATDKTITCKSNASSVVTASSTDGATCNIMASAEGKAIVTIGVNNSSVYKELNVTVSATSSESGSSGSSGSGCSKNCSNVKCKNGEYCNCGKCYTCKPGFRCSNNVSTKCPSGSTSKAGSYYCTATSCPAGQGAEDPLITLCSSCPSGYVSPAGSTKCTPCSGNQVPNSNRSKCTTCPTGTTANSSHTKCE